VYTVGFAIEERTGEGKCPMVWHDELTKLTVISAARDAFAGYSYLNPTLRCALAR
jgi:hypothetical protein